MTIKQTIQELKSESIQFNSNDVLVHVSESNNKLFYSDSLCVFSIDSFPKNILSETKRIKKESGVNVLCLSRTTVEWNLNGNSITTPVIIEPIHFKIDRVSNEITFNIIEEESFINPFVLHHLKEFYALHFNEGEDEIITFLQKNKFTVSSDQQIIGNFHHHRYQVIKELDELLELEVKSPTLKRILGFGDNSNLVTINLGEETLFRTDIDQDSVFDSIRITDTVIQGPPGTGKSQVLSNVLGKVLAKGDTSIVVSEKRAALEVLRKKLSEFKLDKLCFIATSDQLSHSFFRELNDTWNYFEQFQPKHLSNVRLSEQYIDQLQFTLDIISRPDLIGGISFSEFFDKLSVLQPDTKYYNSTVDSIKQFELLKNSIQSIYEQNLHVVLSKLKHSTINSHSFLQFDKKIVDWLETLARLQEVFEISQFSHIDLITKEAILCQIFENEYYKKHRSLFKPNSKNQKKFLSLRKKYNRSKIELSNIQKDNSHWKIIPSEIESNSLLQLLENSSFFNRRKVKKRWNQLTYLPFDKAQIELRSHLEKIGKINTFTRLTIDFCELGVENPETDVDQIFNTIQSLSHDEWNKLAEIPSEKRLKITSFHRVLESIQRDFSSYLNVNSSDDIVELLSNLKLRFGDLVTQFEIIRKFTINTLNGLHRNHSFSEYENEIYSSHLVEFKNNFPSLSEFKPSDLKQKIGEILTLQQEESLHFSTQIEESIHSTFMHYHELLNTPARKLTEKEKELKGQLRKGKSILVKEFSKSKSHPSLREIYNSDARVWISLLKPIWLGNPAQLSKSFPMEEAMFDVAVFDEASQIPLQNALGAIQRSKRIIVAGDEHQMGPTSYFQSGSKEPLDLLHQANFHLTKIPLTHHYRSNHPDLISFSNQFIYGGMLNAYPSFESEKPIQHFYCPKGVFENRVNQFEAKEVAKEIKHRLGNDKSIGVVAFSEEQLNCIWEGLNSKEQAELIQRIDVNTAFFKSLENVQGDECDHLLISFGYGKNDEGEFHHRFGPMNTASGRNRLNVLVTRAKETISFYCSIKSTDFKLSSNESVNLLRQWVSFSENYKKGNSIVFPFNLNPEQQSNKLIVRNIQDRITSSKELITLQNVLRTKGWEIEYL